MKCNIDPSALPRHIGFIMDGNGRWAQQRRLSRKMGHREGVKTIKKIARAAFQIGIKNVSIYAFSTENKNRPKDEVDALVDLLRKNLRPMVAQLLKEGIAVRFMGDLSYFPEDVRKIIADIVADSVGHENGSLNIALNYGSRDEIIRAVNEAVRRGEPVTEDSFSQLLYTAGMPDPDFIVRTSGEMRLSNFLLYQSAYAELYFTDTLWPDFDENELLLAVENYASRNRRFGKV